jgi:DNA-binding MarR family transcriptional regulator
MHLSQKEMDILRFIRRSRHKTTAAEIAKALQLTPKEVEVFVKGMVVSKLINVASGTASSPDAYYTNPEMREEIFDLIG